MKDFLVINQGHLVDNSRVYSFSGGNTITYVSGSAGATMGYSSGTIQAVQPSGFFFCQADLYSG
jgi:hypothetical protein